MTAGQRIWLVLNDASGGFDEGARRRLEQRFVGVGMTVAGTTNFPAGDFPRPAELDAAGIGLVAMFAGDGTANALVRALAGWGGAVLLLPGGTMNLLYHRLHGQRGADEVIGLVAAGRARRACPFAIRCSRGTALVDLLAGPGTSWYEVREALRSADPIAVADSAAHALGQTLAAPGIACREPSLGRREGYPLVMLTPTDDGIRVVGFHADRAIDFVKEGWAVLRHRFREGPHDDLGLVDGITLASTGAEPFGVLLDGERVESPAEDVFRLVPCEVDLLATEVDG